MKHFFLTTLFFLALINLELNAQVLSVKNFDSPFVSTTKVSKSKIFLVDNEDFIDWTFYINEPEKSLLIDLESIKGKSINVSIIAGEDIIFQDDISNLPQHSFYEADLVNFQSGFYTIVLETENEIIIKEMLIQ